MKGCGGVFPVGEKLRPHLVTWTGSAGSRALLAREGRPRMVLNEGYFFNLIAPTPGGGKTTLAHQIIFAHAGPNRICRPAAR